MQLTERPEGHEQLQTLTARLLQQSRRHPVPQRKLQREIARAVESYREARLRALLQDLISVGAVTVLGDGAEPELYWTANLAYVKERLCAILRSHHARIPQEPGVTAGEIKKRFADTQTLNAKRNIDSRLFELAMRECRNDGLIVMTDSGVRLSTFTRPTHDDDRTRELEAGIRAHIRERFCARLDDEELSRRLRADLRTIHAVVSRLVKAGVLILLARRYPVREDRYVDASVVEQAKADLAAALARQDRMSTSEMRTVLGQTRSTTIPLLEYLDNIGFTCREGDFRRLARQK